ncbi:hypothetical protein IHQ71_01340 [Rhizobium sp. TH2]|uniref:hypothetical protein n=1 Tax=Rhizobium sp. TH2 TaxID=2775403 RepID=UPI002157214B|nr:hypothetical protein [Rhizobium sp. TH2]UVC09304.1 hypothetical protein IHQ71_01340 [Rhizobium sp. TH2]
MVSYTEQMQGIFNRYIAEVSASPVSLDEVAEWAIRKRLFFPQPRDVSKLCREALAESLRHEKRVDEKGRKYRSKHSVREAIGGAQLNLWADIDSAPRSFMERSFAQRRKSISDDCFQIKQDVDHFNDRDPASSPIQMILDFSEDVAEMEALRYGGSEAA